MAPVSAQNELATITTSLQDLATRLTALVENEADHLPSDVFTELVGAERTIGTLLRRLTRLSSRLL